MLKYSGTVASYGDVRLGGGISFERGDDILPPTNN